MSSPSRRDTEVQSVIGGHKVYNTFYDYWMDYLDGWMDRLVDERMDNGRIENGIINACGWIENALMRTRMDKLRMNKNVD